MTTKSEPTEEQLANLRYAFDLDGENPEPLAVIMRALLDAYEARGAKVDEQAMFPPVDEFEMNRRGGKWLGAARTWLQRRQAVDGVRGDQITWGDRAAIFGISARDVEDLAACVAAGALNEYGDAQKQIDYMRRKRLEAEMKVSAAESSAAKWMAEVERLRAVAPDCWEHANNCCSGWCVTCKAGAGITDDEAPITPRDDTAKEEEPAK